MDHASLTYLVFFSILFVFFAFPVFSKYRRDISGNVFAVPKRPLLLDWSVMLPCIIYAFLVGFRYDYGYDWMQYFYTFNYIQEGRLFRETTEIGYLFINRLIGLAGGDFYTLLIIESFFWVFSLCFLLRSNRRAIHIVLPLFIASTWFRVLNLSRQHFAMSLFFIAVAFLFEGKKKKYLILALIAASIHTSVLIFIIPFFFLDRIKKIPSLKKILLCYLGAVTLKNVMINVLLSMGTFFTMYVITNKGYTADSLLADTFQWQVSLSKMLSGYFLDVVTILGVAFLLKHSALYDETGKKTAEYYIYILGIVGALLRPIGECHEIFSRTFMYFTYFEYICFGLWIFYLLKHFRSDTMPYWLKAVSILALMYRLYSAFFSLKSQILAGVFIEYIF
ncbi:EpsG family protein [Fibrobacter sp.]|uniref:EpsG family protein n=1 Tax=Fibrobacter sp. TaxID=35828 RepID=UPI003890E023